jgi:ribonuclease HII
MKKVTKIRYIIGIDEVGRGPLAGPVTVCACLVPFLQKDKKSKALVRELSRGKIRKLTDSKGMKEKDREAWNNLIRARSDIFFKIKNAAAKQIDERGIAVCIKKLLNDCLKSLQQKHNINPVECLVLLDGGLKAPQEFIFQETHIKGDTLFPAISFASILAKVHRDAYMKKIAGKHGAYGFEQHKGYGTLAHRKAIKKFGLSDLHRKSFCQKVSVS